jgi:hypothetical protein
MLVEALLVEGAVIALGTAPVCSSFSLAVCPPVRSAAFPAGVLCVSSDTAPKVRQGDSFSTWMCRVAKKCIKLQVACWIRNSSTSWLWRQRHWSKLESRAWIGRCQLEFCVVDYCRCGGLWRTWTAFFTNIPSFCSPILCARGDSHFVLSGCGPGGIAGTAIAEHYPCGFADVLAVLACAAAGISVGQEELSFEEGGNKPCQRCRHRPRRRLQCPRCLRRVGVHCCWRADVGLCYDCAELEPEPEPDGTIAASFASSGEELDLGAAVDGYCTACLRRGDYHNAPQAKAKYIRLARCC